MRQLLLVLVVGLLWAGPALPQGQLIPTATDLGPLRLTRHEVSVQADEQVCTTRIVQTFRNDTGRDLEATYIFPVPKGANVKKLSLWVDGKEMAGELVEANKAREIYTDIVRRTQDPGLLEYVDSNLVRIRVFPVRAGSDQKLAISYTHVADSDAGLIEYTVGLRGMKTPVEHFQFEADLKSQKPLHNIYSPSHSVTITRKGERHAVVRYQASQTAMDRDMQLYWSTASKDVGLQALFHRPDRKEDGHFLLLISPRAELAQTQQQPRDMVFVLDTSGSMQGKRIQQARNALKFCLRQLGEKDRFTILHFATTVNSWQDKLVDAEPNQVRRASTWVERLQATGSTNINDALLAALDLRSSDPERTFTVVFFTDGQPTISVTDPKQILKNVTGRNSAQTRIFTFGVGDDVNTVLLDQLADQTRSVCTYVRENEDIESKVSSLYGKISHAVLTNLKLNVGQGVKISEVYPPQLPDLFHGTQLVVLGRYEGKGHVPVELTGTVEGQRKEFTYEVRFPGKTGESRSFVEGLWARRKVGYLLDQIRINGENKELKDEVTALAKKHGITTPYTSYLVAPEGSANVANAPVPANGRIQYAPVFVNPPMQWAQPSAMGGAAPQSTSPAPVTMQPACTTVAPTASPPAPPLPAHQYRNHGYQINAGAASTPVAGVSPPSTSGTQAVDFAQRLQALRQQSQTAVTQRRVAGRTLVRVGDVWIDDGFDAKQKTVTVKALSKAYFRLLERQPQLREVFQLGKQLVWVTPSGTTLVISAADGVEQMSDEEIDRLFATK